MFESSKSDNDCLAIPTAVDLAISDTITGQDAIFTAICGGQSQTESGKMYLLFMSKNVVDNRASQSSDTVPSYPVAKKFDLSGLIGEYGFRVTKLGGRNMLGMRSGWRTGYIRK